VQRVQEFKRFFGNGGGGVKARHKPQAAAEEDVDGRELVLCVCVERGSDASLTVLGVSLMTESARFGAAAAAGMRTSLRKAVVMLVAGRDAAWRRVWTILVALVKIWDGKWSFGEALALKRYERENLWMMEGRA
jgi:hypothetical protein